ncbi:hypothetical protein Ancab_014052 [Ancistrocladus abbreviatus]
MNSDALQRWGFTLRHLHFWSHDTPIPQQLHGHLVRPSRSRIRAAQVQTFEVQNCISEDTRPRIGIERMESCVLNFYLPRTTEELHMESCRLTKYGSKTVIDMRYMPKELTAAKNKSLSKPLCSLSIRMFYSLVQRSCKASIWTKPTKIGTAGLLLPERFAVTEAADQQGNQDCYVSPFVLGFPEAHRTL